MPGDAGYLGVHKRDKNQDRKINWHVAIRLGKHRALGTSRLDRLPEQYEQARARIRAKVEHPFHAVKNLFRHRKTRYSGLAENTAQLFSFFAQPIW